MKVSGSTVEHYYRNTHTFEKFDFIQGSFSVMGCALHHFQGTEAAQSENITFRKAGKMAFTINIKVGKYFEPDTSSV